MKDEGIMDRVGLLKGGKWVVKKRIEFVILFFGESDQTD